MARCWPGTIWPNGNGIGPSISAGSAFSLLVIETTAGFTWVTSSEKSGRCAAEVVALGGLTGWAWFVSSAWARPICPMAKPPSVVPASSMAASAVRRMRCPPPLA